jgi:hypothetical protein
VLNQHVAALTHEQIVKLIITNVRKSQHVTSIFQSIFQEYSGSNPFRMADRTEAGPCKAVTRDNSRRNRSGSPGIRLSVLNDLEASF